MFARDFQQLAIVSRVHANNQTIDKDTETGAEHSACTEIGSNAYSDLTRRRPELQDGVHSSVFSHSNQFSNLGMRSVNYKTLRLLTVKNPHITPFELEKAFGTVTLGSR